MLSAQAAIAVFARVVGLEKQTLLNIVEKVYDFASTVSAVEQDRATYAERNAEAKAMKAKMSEQPWAVENTSKYKM